MSNQPSFSNPNEEAFNKTLANQSSDKASVQDKFGWLTEVEKIVKQMIKHGMERIPDEFKVKTPVGIVVWLRDVNKQVKSGYVGERLGVILKAGEPKPLLLGFSDAANQDGLWKANTRWHQRDLKEFATDIKPFDIEWLYGSWQRSIDFAYLLLPDDKVSAKLLQACRNQEIRKWLVKRFGQTAFQNGTAKIVDEETYADVATHGGQIGNHEPENKTGQYLYDVEIEGQRHRFVHVIDKAPLTEEEKKQYGKDFREYELEVPYTDGEGRGFGRREADFPIKTVHDAVAWTFQMKPGEYKPSAES